MAYLILATRNQYGEITASYTTQRTLGRALFQVLVDNTNSIDTITNDNLSTFTTGRIYRGMGRIEDYTDDEALVRALGFRKCDVCGTWCTPQDIRAGVSTWDIDTHTRRCALCEAKKNQIEDIYLKGYHDTSYNVAVINGDGENFTLDNVQGFGMEFEYYNGDQDEYMKSTSRFSPLVNGNNPLFRVERDCTVSGEIISNVFTKKTLYEFDWSIITDVMKVNKNIEGNDEAGLHVHASKTWLGSNDDPKTQCLNFLKLQYFMKSYEEDFLKMSGRKRERMGYCQFFSHSEIENMKSYITRYDNPWGYMPCSHGGGRGCALNNSGKTIEFRIGRNTNDPERIKHYLRFIAGIVENIKNVPFEKCYCIGKVTKLVPSDTMAYWRKQGCFLNTNAINTRGVTL